MCFAMYLYTNSKIEEINGDNNDPVFFVEDIKKKKKINYNDSNSLKWNENNKEIYYIGSSQGCGCGWKSPDYDSIDMNDEDDREELNNRIKDRISLYKLLENCDLRNSYIIFCREGDEGKGIRTVEKLNIKNILNVDYDFNRLIKYILEK
jgi:hypothetical protein